MQVQVPLLAQIPSSLVRLEVTHGVVKPQRQCQPPNRFGPSSWRGLLHLGRGRVDRGTP